MIDPQRGEVWLVKLDPTVGAEIQKTRPAVVVHANALAYVPLRIIVPITSWQPRFATRPYMVPIAQSPTNGLSRDSGANVLQVRCVSVERLTKKIGTLTDAEVEEIVAGVALCMGYT